MPDYPSTPLYSSRRSVVMGDAMVATSQPLAAQAGLRMLARGGNAVDAALAAAITLTVVEPTGNGLGSDAFAVLWDGRELHGLNASGRSPAGWEPARFAGRTSMPARGWESVTVPGAVGGWVALSKRFGTLPFRDLFEPAIHYAETGFPVTPVITALWSRGTALLGDQPGFADQFNPGGRAPRAGERFIPPDLAGSLRAIAETDGAAFYRGEIAGRIAEAAAAHGAALDRDDLDREAPDWCGTLSQQFDDATLHEIPPNGQGIAACMALGMLSHTRVREFTPDSPEAIHLMAEATKLALRDIEAHLADPAYMQRPRADDLLDAAYLADRAGLIDPGHAGDAGAGAPRRGGTVYLTAADADGMMVSFIQSNYAGFGSGVVVPGTGVHLQNRGAGFTLEPGHPNEVGPRKRPFHTIIPGFLMRDAQPLMSFGVMGGPMQAQGHLQMALRTELWGQDVQTAADAPRWRVGKGHDLALESAVPEQTVAALRALGHSVSVEPPEDAFGFGGAQLIRRLAGGGYAGASDPRKDGLVAAL